MVCYSDFLFLLPIFSVKSFEVCDYLGHKDTTDLNLKFTCNTYKTLVRWQDFPVVNNNKMYIKQ